MEQILDKLRDDFAIAGEFESFEPIDGDTTFRVVFKADEGRAVATIQRASGATEVIHEANLSRERVRIVELAAFDPEEIDMLTIVIIGATTYGANC